MMRILTKGLVVAITCIMLLSSMPVMALQTYGMAGGSSITGNGAFVTTGGSVAQITDTQSDDPGERTIFAEIRAEVEIPSGKKGEVGVEWDVPESTSSTLTVSNTDDNYELTVAAFGNVAVEAAKETTTGRAYSLAEIYSLAHADWDAGSPPMVDGFALIDSEVFLTGTGAVTSSADGAASYSAALGSLGADGEQDLFTEGMVEGATSIAASNFNGGTIEQYLDSNLPAQALLYVDSQAAPGATNAYTDNLIGLAASRSNIRSGDAFAEATVAGAVAAVSEVSDVNGAMVDETAVLGCEGPVTIDSSASVSAPSKTDEAEAYTNLYVFADADALDESDEFGAYARASINTFAYVSRPSTCCVSGDMVMALSEITDAVWDAAATNDFPDDIDDPWEVCISGATGLTRDGDPDVATEPGFATGATTVNRNRDIFSENYAVHDAFANSDLLYTSSFVELTLNGPKYSNTVGTVDDAAGARFAIDYMTMGTGNGIPVLFGDTALATNIAGPDAFLWVTSENPQTINGHYADDGISTYVVDYTPLGFGMTFGPEIVTATGTNRMLDLYYATEQFW